MTVTFYFLGVTFLFIVPSKFLTGSTSFNNQPKYSLYPQGCKFKTELISHSRSAK